MPKHSALSPWLMTVLNGQSVDLISDIMVITINVCKTPMEESVLITEHDSVKPVRYLLKCSQKGNHIISLHFLFLNLQKVLHHYCTWWLPHGAYNNNYRKTEGHTQRDILGNCSANKTILHDYIWSDQPADHPRMTTERICLSKNCPECLPKRSTKQIS